MFDISIIMPAYNVEDYIRPSIESVLSQTYQNWELIIINDGSSDNTRLIAEEYVKRDNRITLINKENEGVSVARNLGLDIAKGSFISFLDSDDTYNTNYIELMSSPLKSGVAEMSFCKFKETKNNIVISKTPENAPQKFHDIFIHYICNTQEAMTANMAIMYNLELLRKYNIRFHAGCGYAEDAEFVLKYASLTKAVLIPEYLYNYIARPGSASRSGYSFDMFFGEIDAYIRTITFIKKNNYPESKSFVNYIEKKIISTKNRIKRPIWRSIKDGKFEDALNFLNRYESKYNAPFHIPFKEIDSKKFWFKIKILQSRNQRLWRLVKTRSKNER